MATIKTISIIVPVYNEAENIARLYREISVATKSLKQKVEVIFVDDGSRDDSIKIVNELAAKSKNIRLIELTRNFGKEIATTAGLRSTEADAAIIIDADLQHPPNLIPHFVSQWQKGSLLVIGVREGGKEQGLVRNTASKTYYKILNAISSTPIKPHATDYRLLDRVVIDEFNRFTERNRLSRGLIDWLGFEQDYIYFIANKRQNGQSYSRVKLLRLAVNSFVSHSMLPLRLAGYLGIGITCFAGFFGVFVIIEQYLLNDPWDLHFSGSAQLAILLVFLVGIILICMGLIALYIANIHDEVMNRPMYVVKRK